MSCCCRIWARQRSKGGSQWARRSSSTSRPSPTATAHPTASSARCYELGGLLGRELPQLGHRTFQSMREALDDFVDFPPGDAERRRKRIDLAVGQGAQLHTLFERLAGDDAVGLGLRVEKPAALL